MPTRAPCLLFDELWNWQSRCWKNTTVTGWDNFWWGEMSIFKTLPVTPSLGGNIELQNITAVLQISICQPGFHQAVDTARLNSSRAHKTHVTTVWNHVYRLCVHVVAVKRTLWKAHHRSSSQFPSRSHSKAFRSRHISTGSFTGSLVLFALRSSWPLKNQVSSSSNINIWKIFNLVRPRLPFACAACNLPGYFVKASKKNNKSSTNCHLSLSSRQRLEPVAPHRPDKISFCHKMKPSRSLCVILSQASGDRRMKPGLC